uniref:Uncharacterized protein n=1 Tax=Ciona savignyi TaxID=51511 RepID=H2ZQ43_CIOSA
GFSASFTRDNRKIVLGAVGSYYNQGSIMLILDLMQNISSLPYHTAEFKPVVPPGWSDVDYYRHTYDSNYLGYSVATGITGSNLPLLVTSAPRRLGYNLLGSVIVYDENMEVPLANFTGQQIGEYFGEGLAVVDLNNDGLDDVIVGSPLYSDVIQKIPEVGRIYIFYQLTGKNFYHNFTHLTTIIDGKASMGRFGKTIVPIGDVNGDGFNDILVSAPYERNGTDGSEEQFGAVYLFNGGADGARTTPSQVIHGVNLENTPNFTPTEKVRGLGYAMKGGKDVDQNGYPDVILGAYLSDQVVVIKSRPVVNLLVVQTITPTKIDLETLSCDLGPTSKSACFYIQTCFSYSGKTLPASVNISYSYDVDSGKPDNEKRSFLLDNSPRNTTLLATSAQQCHDETVFMQKDVRDKQTEIAVTVSYWLQETHQPTEPVLDVLAGTSSTTRADIFKDCGPDEICIPDLHVMAELLLVGTVLVGTYTEITLSTAVWNTAENAYLTTIVVNYPQYVSFVGLQEDKVGDTIITCLDLSPFLLCEVANPLKLNARVDIDIVFGVNDLQGEINMLEFLTYANCTNEHNSQSTVVSTPLQVEVQADVQFYNVSTPSLIRLDRASENAALNLSASKPLTHTYEITNAGPAVISNAAISLFWPLTIGENKDLLLPLLEVVHSGPVNCHYTHIVNASIAKSNDILVPAETTPAQEASGSKKYINCHTAPENCYEMTCDVSEMQPKTHILIELRTDLHLAPVLQTSMDTVITSSLEFTITKFPYLIQPGPGPTSLSEVNTYAEYPQVSEPSSVEWWIVLIAVLAGVLFLLLIILILWRCGFFKRKQHPQSEDDKQQRQKLYVEESPD